MYFLVCRLMTIQRHSCVTVPEGIDWLERTASSELRQHHVMTTIVHRLLAPLSDFFKCLYAPVYKSHFRDKIVMLKLISLNKCLYGATIHCSTAHHLIKDASYVYTPYFSSLSLPNAAYAERKKSYVMPACPRLSSPLTHTNTHTYTDKRYLQYNYFHDSSDASPSLSIIKLLRRVTVYI